MAYFDDMTDDDIKQTFRRFAVRSQYSIEPKKMFRQLAVEETGVEQYISISFSEQNSAGQRMHMGMVFSPNNNGNIISF